MIHYRDIGDYLSREEKLAIVADSTLDAVPWQQITPNRHGDWINQRDEDYLTYPILGGQPSDGVRAFENYSRGLETNRDAWVYNSSRTTLDANLARFIETYDAERSRFAQHVATHNLTAPKGSDTVGVVSTDDTQIKWNRSLRDRLAKGRALTRQPGHTTVSLYRPFNAQHIDHSDGLVYLPAVARRYFPTAQHDNYGFYLLGLGASKDFSAFGVRHVPDLNFYGSEGGQFFPATAGNPLRTREPSRSISGRGGRRLSPRRQHHRRLHRLLQGRYGDQVTKDDVFFPLRPAALTRVPRALRGGA